MTVTAEVIHAVTNLTAEYVQRWAAVEAHALTAALVLLTAGCGTARVPSCEQILRRVPYRSAAGGGIYLRCLRPLLLRALSLFNPGELRELCVADAKVLDLVLEQVEQTSDAEQECDLFAACATEDPLPTVSLSTSLPQALRSLRVVSWPQHPTSVTSVFKLIERHADTITKLNGMFHRGKEAPNRALAQCTKLESLSHARCFAPSAWLGLSQLHTLDGVDLSVVPVEAIAASLPRLHSLDAVFRYSPGDPPGALAGFFDVLLPRLRTFRFFGEWPSQARPEIRQPATLPQLQELQWIGHCSSGVALGFMGAQPALLRATPAMVGFLNDVGLDEAAHRPLARLRELALVQGVAPDGGEVARLLRAAPHLRTFAVDLVRSGDRTSAVTADAAFVGLVHSRLRQLHLTRSHDFPLPAGSAPRLRVLHFPRLRQMTVDGCNLLLADEDSVPQ
jgi:hypothetical protein